MTYDPAAAINPLSDRFVSTIGKNTYHSHVGRPDARLDDDLFSRNRLNKDLLSHFPYKTGGNQWMLDLGCGDRQFASDLTSFTGFNYVGVDYQGPSPDLLADIHALPFKDASFDFVISIAVLEHVSHPDIAMARSSAPSLF
jgi:SAM-dependent methyltransferase